MVFDGVTESSGNDQKSQTNPVQRRGLHECPRPPDLRIRASCQEIPDAAPALFMSDDWEADTPNHLDELANFMLAGLVYQERRIGDRGPQPALSR